MKFCGSCGQQIPDNANACPYCGAFQDSAVPAAKAKKAFPVTEIGNAFCDCVIRSLLRSWTAPRPLLRMRGRDTANRAR